MAARRHGLRAWRITKVADSGRKSERHALSLNARCRKSSWLVDHVELADISEGGCCIVGGGEGLTVGQAVTIRFADLKGVPGTICWTKDTTAGVTFDTPLDPALIDELSETYAFKPSKVTNIRDFANRR